MPAPFRGAPSQARRRPSHSTHGVGRKCESRKNTGGVRLENERSSFSGERRELVPVVQSRPPSTTSFPSFRGPPSLLLWLSSSMNPRSIVDIAWYFPSSATKTALTARLRNSTPCWGLTNTTSGLRSARLATGVNFCTEPPNIAGTALTCTTTCSCGKRSGVPCCICFQFLSSDCGCSCTVDLLVRMAEIIVRSELFNV